VTTATTLEEASAVDIDSRVGARDWPGISQHLDAHGWAMFNLDIMMPLM
jgi:hypothetical protein